MNELEIFLKELILLKYGGSFNGMVEKRGQIAMDTTLSRNLATKWSGENASWRTDVDSKEFLVCVFFLLLFFDKFLCLNAVMKGRN